MTQITRVPWGLQHLLGTQAFGDNPSEFGQVVMPTLDMGRYFDFDHEKWWIEAGAAINNQEGLDASQTVPEGEIWLVKGIGMGIRYTGNTVGDSCRVSIDVNQLQDSNSPGTGHPIAPYPELLPGRLRRLAILRTGILSSVPWFSNPVLTSC